MAKNFLKRFSQKNADDTPAEQDRSVESLTAQIADLERAVADLSILNDLALAMGRSVDPQDIVEQLVNKLMRIVRAEQAVVTLLDPTESGGQKTKVRVMTRSREGPGYRLSESLMGWMILHKESLVMNDPRNDPRFKGITLDESIRSIMSVPLMLKSELMGTLTIYNKKGGGGFDEGDQRLLPAIAAYSAQIIDNARLSRESAHMEEQVRLAYEIQRNLLPDAPPDIEGYDIAGASEPAQTVGGDYYDFIAMEDGRCAVCLGDVSGKGVPASLLMANIQATLRGQVLVNASVHETIERSNKLLEQSTDDEKFVTLFYGVLDPATHTLSFCNAGHERPFVLRATGGVERLDPGGMAIGVLEDVPFKEDVISLHPGDTVVIYSDGITDAINKSEEAFGEERLAAVIETHKDQPAAVLVKKIFDVVRKHEGDAQQFDDLTVVVVKRRG